MRHCQDKIVRTLKLDQFWLWQTHDRSILTFVKLKLEEKLLFKKAVSCNKQFCQNFGFLITEGKSPSRLVTCWCSLICFRVSTFTGKLCDVERESSSIYFSLFLLKVEYLICALLALVDRLVSLFL